jgi:hypothetical protein
MGLRSLNYGIVTRNGICFAVCVLVSNGLMAFTYADEKKDAQEPTRPTVSAKRSMYDALVWINRMPEKLGEGETPLQIAGRVLGRLASHESRNLVKLPYGMKKDTYLAMKTFFRYEGDSKVGNCAACHTPMEFDGSDLRVAAKGGQPTKAPSLRNLESLNLDLEKILLAKIESADQKKTGEADDIDDAFLLMNITKEDVPGLVAFLNSLNDISFVGHRKAITDVELLDTSDFWD